jgi:hypothetical protein
MGDTSVAVALGHGLEDRGSRVRFSAGAGNFSLHHRCVQNGSGAHPASYPMGTRGCFAGGKAAGAWSWPLTSTYYRGQRMGGAIPPFPQYALMACNFTLPFSCYRNTLWSGSNSFTIGLSGAGFSGAAELPLLCGGSPETGVAQSV